VTDAVVVDTSAWIEYLRQTGSPHNLAIRKAIREADELLVVEPAYLELLAGPRDDAGVREIHRFVNQFEIVTIAPLVDSVLAAELYRACRRKGETVRTMIDCLIAAIALRRRAAVLAKDQDFEVLARHTPLRLVPTR